MKISDLNKNQENPRTITDAKKKMLLKALRRFGDLSGIVYNTKTHRLVGGHQRRDIFDPKTPIVISKSYSKPTKTGTTAEGYIEAKGERFVYREVYWDEPTERAANIAANKGAGEWDPAKLKDWIQSLNSFDIDFDLDLTMFDPKEIKDVVGIEVAGYTRTTSESTGVDEDDIPEKPEPKSKLGDLYLLGGHRLLCGDSLDKASVERLMDGVKAEMCFTDPPYGVDYTGGIQAKRDGTFNKNGRERLKNDENDDIYSSAIPMVAEFTDGPVYTWFAGSLGAKIYPAIEKVGQVHNLMVWNKVNAGFGALNAHYKQKHEVFLYWKPKGSTLRWNGPGNEVTIWEQKREMKNEFHPTQKPVQLAERAMMNHTASTVLDLFGGSGSTMIAAEKTARRCFTMEIDPGYVDVIVARWENYTGLKAKLIRAKSKKAGKQPASSHAEIR